MEDNNSGKCAVCGAELTIEEQETGICSACSGLFDAGKEIYSEQIYMEKETASSPISESGSAAVRQMPVNAYEKKGGKDVPIIAVILQLLGCIMLVAGTIGAAWLADDVEMTAYSYTYTEFSWSLFLTNEFIVIVGSILVYGFGEIIGLLKRIKDLLNEIKNNTEK